MATAVAEDGEFAVSAVPVDPLQARWLSATGKLVGEAAAARLADALEQPCSTGCPFTWLDLSHVPMLDRAGFDVLAEAHARFLTVGAALILTGVAPRIARLLELTGQDQTVLTVVAAPDPHRMTCEPQREGGHSRDADDGESAEQLSAPSGRCVDERSMIDRAVGVVMGRTRCSVAEAIEQLLVLSRATNRALGEVAQSVLDESARRSVGTGHEHPSPTDLDGTAHRSGTMGRATEVTDGPGPESSSRGRAD